MTQFSPNRHLPYPELGDSADVPRDIKALALSLDSGGAVGVNVLSQIQVRDIGEQNQRRAGRVLTAADFTNMGLTAPVGLWNLGDLTDASGNGRVLSNKGGVAFTTGITGSAIEAAQFAGSTGQALYISDTGAADPFRIKTGSVGCWFRTAKRGTTQDVMAKWGVAAQAAWLISIGTTNAVSAFISSDGTAAVAATGTTDVCDDRWHHAIVTYDGTRVRLYIDGTLDGTFASSGPIFGGSSPMDIGIRPSDSTNTAGGTNPHYGRVDEAFVTSDVLSPEQVLNLYCTRVPHTLVDSLGAAVAPTGILLNVRRRKRGAALAAGNFPATPVRLHNFVAGALTDSGSGGVSLTPVGGGSIVSTAAPDGTRDGAQSFSGAHTGLGATDAGLPAGTATRSFGAWFKTTNTATNGAIVSWGTTGNLLVYIAAPGGAIFTVSGADSITGPFAADGLWHHAVVTEDNAAGDGVKRKLYLDGRLVAGSTVLNGVTLAGANRFRVGANPDGTSPFTGQISRAFVYAGALTDTQIRALYNVGSQTLAASPKTEGSHVEALETTGVLAHFDALEGTDLVDMSVVA